LHLDVFVELAAEDRLSALQRAAGDYTQTGAETDAETDAQDHRGADSETNTGTDARADAGADAELRHVGLPVDVSQQRQLANLLVGRRVHGRLVSRRQHERHQVRLRRGAVLRLHAQALAHERQAVRLSDVSLFAQHERHERGELHGCDNDDHAVADAVSDACANTGTDATANPGADARANAASGMHGCKRLWLR